jgi:hypothetical protein
VYSSSRRISFVIGLTKDTLLPNPYTTFEHSSISFVVDLTKDTLLPNPYTTFEHSSPKGRKVIPGPNPKLLKIKRVVNYRFLM